MFAYNIYHMLVFHDQMEAIHTSFLGIFPNVFLYEEPWLG